MSAELRDLIYFDFNKAASLFSQVEGGLLKEVQEKAEAIHGRNASGSLDLKVLKAGLGNDTRDTTSILESRVLHHDLLTRLEQWLKRQGQLLDLNTFGNEQSSGQPLDFSNEAIRSAIKNPALLTAEGWAEFQDLKRLNASASKINELGQFFNRAAIEKIKETPSYQEIQQQIETLKQTVKESPNRDAKAKAGMLIRSLEKSLEQMLDYKQALIPEWIVAGIQLLTSTLMPNRLQLRVYPFEQNPQFSVMANLKRDCFLDADFENVLFAYGPRPNVLLTVFGLTTSMPAKNALTFDPAAQLATLSDKERQIEDGFRQMFRAFEEMEGLVRFSYYPNITLYPIAVYQRLGTLVPDEEGSEIPNGLIRTEQ